MNPSLDDSGVGWANFWAVSKWLLDDLLQASTMG